MSTPSHSPETPPTPDAQPLQLKSQFSATPEQRQQYAVIRSEISHITQNPDAATIAAKLIAECDPQALVLYDKKGVSLLKYCVKHGTEDLCLQLLEKAPALGTIDFRYKYNKVSKPYSAGKLHLAIEKRYDKLAVRLLELNPNLPLNESLLVAANRNHCSDTVDLLLQRHCPRDEILVETLKKIDINRIASSKDAIPLRALMKLAALEPKYLKIACQKTNLTVDEIRNLSNRFIEETDIREFFNDIVYRLLVPAYAVMRMPNKNTIEDLPEITERDKHEFKTILVDRLIQQCRDEGMGLNEIFQHFEQLSTTWHHLGAFPDLNYTILEGIDANLIKQLTLGRSWHPLLPEDVTINLPIKTANGQDTTKPFTFHSLTSTQELKAESDKHGHCVHSYSNRCSSEEPPAHIVALSSPEWEEKNGKGQQQCSTIEFCLIARDKVGFSRHRVEIPNSNLDLVMIQHETGTTHIHSNNKFEPRERELVEALNMFMKQVKEGKITLNTTELGETEKSKSTSDLPLIIKTCGYFPTWENIEKVFREYKNPVRDGAVETDANGRLIHTEPRRGLVLNAEISPMLAFDTDAPTNLKHMTVGGWLHTTGMLEDMQKMITQKDHTRDGSYWRQWEQDHADFLGKHIFRTPELEARIANGAPLNAIEQRFLTPKERGERQHSAEETSKRAEYERMGHRPYSYFDR